jgi:hypothetical protein
VGRRQGHGYLPGHVAVVGAGHEDRLEPGRPGLQLPVSVRADGKGRREFEPIMRAIRAFYADLQAWAAAEPEQWAIWVAPCPASDAEVRGFGVRKRRVKERMDDRTR